LLYHKILHRFFQDVFYRFSQFDNSYGQISFHILFVELLFSNLLLFLWWLYQNLKHVC